MTAIQRLPPRLRSSARAAAAGRSAMSRIASVQASELEARERSELRPRGDRDEHVVPGDVDAGRRSPPQGSSVVSRPSAASAPARPGASESGGAKQRGRSSVGPHHEAAVDRR